MSRTCSAYPSREISGKSRVNLGCKRAGRAPPRSRSGSEPTSGRCRRRSRRPRASARASSRRAPSPGESRRISASLGESRRVSASLGESRLISRVELVARDGDDERVDERAHERLTATCSRTSSRAARAGLEEGKGVAPRRSEASPMITSVLLEELLLLAGGEARRGTLAIQCYDMRLEEEQRRPQPDTVHRLRPRPAVARRGLREIWGDMGRYGEIWGDMGRYGGDHLRESCVRRSAFERKRSIVCSLPHHPRD